MSRIGRGIRSRVLVTGVISAPAVFTYEKSGSGIAVLASSGTKSGTYNKTGSGVAAFVGAGTKSTTFTKTGAYIVAWDITANPGFEIDTAEWNVRLGTETLTRDTLEFHSGVASGKIVTPGNATLEGVYTKTQGLTIRPGDAVQGSIWLKAPVGAQMRLRATTVASGLYAEFGPGLLVIGDGAWHKHDYLTLNVTINADEARIETHITNVPQAITYYIDDATLVYSQNPRYASGFAVKDFAETGAGIASFAASGTKSVEAVYIKTGAGVTEFVSSGASAAQKTYEKTGVGVSSFAASAADASTFVETALNISWASYVGGLGNAHGSDNSNTLVFVTQRAVEKNQSVLLLVRTNTYVSTITVGNLSLNLIDDEETYIQWHVWGAKATQRIPSGSTVTITFVAPVNAASKDAIGEVFSGMGTAAIAISSDAFTTSGPVVFPLTNSSPQVGDMAVAFVQTPSSETFTGYNLTISDSSFSRQAVGYYQILENGPTGGQRFTVSALADVFAGLTVYRTTANALAAVASGADAVTLSRGGVVQSDLVASGAKTIEKSKTGAAVAGFVATGADVTETTEIGSTVLEAVASGVSVAQKISEKSGAAVTALTALGARNTSLERSGAAVSTFYASGSWVGISFARPATDIADGTWTDQDGGTNLAPAIDEVAADDADYIKSASSPATVDVCEIKLTTLLDPLSSDGHIVRYRYGKDLVGGDTISLTVRLMQGTTEIVSWVHADLPSGWTLAEQTLSGAQADAISDYSDLRAKFEAVKV